MSKKLLSNFGRLQLPKCMPAHTDSLKSSVLIDDRELTPRLVFKYDAFKYYLSKLKMWKLKWTWDRSFSEQAFIEKSKEMAVKLTDVVRLQDVNKIGEFSSSNVYYQMSHDLIKFPHKSCLELLRFRTQDIRQAVPIGLQMHNILGIKYALIDVAMAGLRRVADCESESELESMKTALSEIDPELKQLLQCHDQLPSVFVEIFMRFRRNYTTASEANDTNDWLVSIYKICKFNIFTTPPTF